MSPLRVSALLKASGLTAYQLAKRSGGAISMSAAYRMARGEIQRLSAPQVAALCEVLDCDPGDLFADE